MEALLPGPTANFRCGKPKAIPDDFNGALDFGFDFEYEGNFTLTWSMLQHGGSLKAFCGIYFFVVEALVRRTKFQAFPVIINTSREFDFKFREFEPPVNYVLAKDVDLSLEYHLLTNDLFNYVDISYSYIKPALSIISGYYPNTKSNPLFGIINVFDPEIWLLILLILFLSPIQVSLESILFTTDKSSKISKWRMIKYYGTHLWSSWNAMFMQTYPFLHLDRLTYLLVIGFLLVFKVFITTLFSSQILSITIDDPFVVIDSFVDLNERQDLIPMLFAKDQYIQDFLNEKDTKEVVERVLNNKHGEKLRYGFINLFQSIDELIDNIGVKKSHVLLAAAQDGEIIINMNKNRYSQLIRISNQHYFEKMIGYIFRKNTNPILKNTFKEIIYSTRETGLTLKWQEVSLINAYKMFASDDQVYQIKSNEQSFCIDVDELKVVLGPFLVGMLFAFIALAIECYFKGGVRIDQTIKVIKVKEIILSKESVLETKLRPPVPPIY